MNADQIRVHLCKSVDKKSECGQDHHGARILVPATLETQGSFPPRFDYQPCVYEEGL
jgi:hypothetical protein